MKAMVAIVVVLLLAGTTDAQQLTGQARAIDGDTLEIAGQRVRLWGIDAPELGQVCFVTLYPDGSVSDGCGRKAQQELADLVRGTVTCEPKDRDRYGRVVAVCKSSWQWSRGTESGGQTIHDIGGAMVLSVWAVDYTKYSGGAYAADQAKAKAEKRGIWAWPFDMPEDWRKRRKAGQ